CEIACAIPLEISKKKQLVPGREINLCYDACILFYTGQTASSALLYFKYTERILGPFVFLRDPLLIETGRAHPENPADTLRQSHFVHSCALSNYAGRAFALMIL
ncbi:MAG TPA: hypothetical protein VE176_05210, partial [Candidatus Limnocylindrales bacterium]|nr:hypothetical protein [Candidatus Limnocylindrales bacterium]